MFDHHTHFTIKDLIVYKHTTNISEKNITFAGDIASIYLHSSKHFIV